MDQQEYYIGFFSLLLFLIFLKPAIEYGRLMDAAILVILLISSIYSFERVAFFAGAVYFLYSRAYFWRRVFGGFLAAVQNDKTQNL